MIGTQSDYTANSFLFDLFLKRRYKSGLNFLLNVCKVKVDAIQQE